MRVKNENPEKETKAVAIVESLLTEQVLEDKFKHLNKKLSKLQEYAVDVVVETEDNLTLAEQNSSSVNETLKNIEEVRKTLGAPYLATTKELNAFVKKLSIPFGDVKTQINAAITNFKTVQAAMAAEEAEKKKLEIEALVDVKAEELNRINRIQAQLTARIYGGKWKDKNNITKESSGCQNKADCDILLDLIKTKVPKPDTFKHFKKEYAHMLLLVKKNLAKMHSDLIGAESTSITIQNESLKSIEENRLKAKVNLNDSSDEMKHAVINEAKKEIKSAEQEVQNVSKGVRNNLKFELDDITKVPTEWLLIDETKVRAWALENKELLKAQMKAGDNVINGIKFSIEQVYVSK